MRIKIFNTEITVTFLFAATVSFMLATDRTGLILPTLFAVLIHETGHLFAMWAGDCAPKEIRLIPASVQITERYPRSSAAQIWVIISGPLANIAVAAALFINRYTGGRELSLRFGLINLVAAAFNLMPVAGLDGGRLLCALLCLKKDLFSAMRTVRIVTVLFSAALLFFGVFLLLSGKGNPTLVTAALYLSICAFMKT